MSKHPVYNEDNTGFNALAAWYMTEGTQKLLVLHNMGSTTLQVPLSDTVDKAIAVTGNVNQQDNFAKLQMEGYSSIVLLLK